MPTSNPSVKPWSRRAARALAVLSIALLSCSSAGCGKRTTYVSGDHKLTRLKTGQPAPHAGVLMSEQYLSDIYEALDTKTCTPKPPRAQITEPVPRPTN